MTLPTMTKKAVTAASAVALTFTLTACGGGNETSGGGLSTAASAPGATVAEAPSEVEAPDGEPSTSKKPEEGKETTNNQQRQDNPGQQQDVALPTIINPLEEGFEAPTYEPIADGREGTEAERREMEEVVYKVTNPESFATWTRTILDNSCAALREPAMEEFERQGLTLDMVEQLMKTQEAQGATIDMPATKVSVSDVRVSGDRASASVTSENSSGTATNVQLFAKEDGRWKLCTG